MLILPEKRDKLYKYLSKSEIDTRKIYEKTIPQQRVYAESEEFPMAEWFCKHGLSLPLYEGLFPEEIDYVCEKIKECITS